VKTIIKTVTDLINFIVTFDPATQLLGDVMETITSIPDDLLLGLEFKEWFEDQLQTLNDVQTYIVALIAEYSGARMLLPIQLRSPTHLVPAPAS